MTGPWRPLSVPGPRLKIACTAPDDNIGTDITSSTVICKAFWTFTPTDRSYTFIIWFALLVAEARVIILPHTATFRRCASAAPIRFLSIDMGIPAAGAAVVVVPVRTLGTALVRREAAFVIPGTF